MTWCSYHSYYIDITYLESPRPSVLTGTTESRINKNLWKSNTVSHYSQRKRGLSWSNIRIKSGGVDINILQVPHLVITKHPVFRWERCLVSSRTFIFPSSVSNSRCSQSTFSWKTFDRRVGRSLAPREPGGLQRLRFLGLQGIISRNLQLDTWQEGKGWWRWGSTSWISMTTPQYSLLSGRSLSCWRNEISLRYY